MVLSCFCFCVLKCRKTLRERRGSKMLSEGGKKKNLLWMLPGGENVKLDLNFLFVFEKNVTAYEIWGLWKTECSEVTLWDSPQLPHVGCFSHVTDWTNCNWQWKLWSPLFSTHKSQSSNYLSPIIYSSFHKYCGNTYHMPATVSCCETEDNTEKNRHLPLCLGIDHLVYTDNKHNCHNSECCQGQ